MAEGLTPLYMHPAFGAVVYVLLCLWPLARIFKRRGYSPFYALLAFANLLLPMLGIIICALLLCRQPKQVTYA